MADCEQHPDTLPRTASTGQRQSFPCVKWIKRMIFIQFISILSWDSVSRAYMCLWAAILNGRGWNALTPWALYQTVRSEGQGHCRGPMLCKPYLPGQLVKHTHRTPHRQVYLKEWCLQEGSQRQISSYRAGESGPYLRGEGTQARGMWGGCKHGAMNSPSLPKESIIIQSRGTWYTHNMVNGKIVG